MWLAHLTSRNEHPVLVRAADVSEKIIKKGVCSVEDLENPTGAGSVQDIKIAWHVHDFPCLFGLLSMRQRLVERFGTAAEARYTQSALEFGLISSLHKQSQCRAMKPSKLNV